VLRLPWLAGMLLLVAAAARAQPDAPVLADDLQIVVLPREVLSIDARSGGQLAVPLELGEQVLWTGVRGRVGVALSNRRVLAVSTRSGAWQEARYRRTEDVPGEALLGGRVALLATRVRVIGFDGGSGNLVERELGPRELLVDRAVADNVAVAVTDRRALGLSSFVGGFFETKLRLGERLDGLAATANAATLTTSQRLLIFRAPTGTWEERNLDVR